MAQARQAGDRYAEILASTTGKQVPGEQTHRQAGGWAEAGGKADRQVGRGWCQGDHMAKGFRHLSEGLEEQPQLLWNLLPPGLAGPHASPNPPGEDSPLGTSC